MIWHMLRFLLLCATMMFSVIPPAYGTAYNFITVDYPGSRHTTLNGINNSGQTVGSFSTNWPNDNGFIRDSSGNFTNTLNFSSAFATLPYSINNNGTVVGAYMINADTPPNYGGYPQGFRYQSGSYDSIAYPNAPNTWALGINDIGTIVGMYTKSSSQYHYAFVKVGNTFQSLDILNANQSGASGVNNSGQIVGYINNSSNTLVDVHGFFRDSGGNATRLDFPGVPVTAATDINNVGQIVGYYYDTVNYVSGGGWSLSGLHGYLLDNGIYSTIDFPSGLETQLYGINDYGWLVGSYWDGTKGVGFIAQPLSPAVPEPATMLLFGTGLAGLAAARRRKKAC